MAEYRNTITSFEIAAELWTIAGNVAVGREILAARDRGFDSDGKLMDATDVSRLCELLASLEAALESTVVDSSWELGRAKIEELRAVTRTLNLADGTEFPPEDALLDGMARVDELRRALEEALAHGYRVGFE